MTRKVEPTASHNRPWSIGKADRVPTALLALANTSARSSRSALMRTLVPSLLLLMSFSNRSSSHRRLWIGGEPPNGHCCSGDSLHQRVRRCSRYPQVKQSAWPGWDRRHVVLRSWDKAVTRSNMSRSVWMSRLTFSTA